MFKTTLFVAVQCCQCSTMQVKQQKKSSNKWTCVVCNQKQSARKVYARGYQAKDIRQFVQSFNMSRKVTDEQALLSEDDPSLGHFVEQLEEDKEIEPKRRTNWREYIDDEGDGYPSYLKSKLDERGLFELEIVMELPEGLRSKKPKVKGTYGSSSPSSGLRYADRENCKPQVSTTKEISATRFRLSTAESMWHKFDKELTRNTSRGLRQESYQSKHMPTAEKGAYKWGEYMTGDDDDGYVGAEASFADDLKLVCSHDPETYVADQKVEDDIHPDFL